MSKPTQSIFPIENGKLTTALDCNNLQLINLDESNLSGGGGNGAPHTVTFVGSYSAGVLTANEAVFLDEDIGATISGGALPADTFIVSVTSSTVVEISDSVDTESDVTLTFDRLPAAGNDTGTTTAILKGDGNHGFADAVAGVDYASAGSVAGFETATDHDADIAIVTADITTLTTNLSTLTTTVGTKANSSDVTTSLALKTDLTAFNAYVSSNDAAVALKANSSDMTTALAAKADTSALTAGLALKEPLLPTSPTDGWILSGNTDDSKTWVDPVTLGTTNQTFNDGVSNTDTSWSSEQANFVDPDDVGLAITGTDIQAGTTIVSVLSQSVITLSQATTGTGTLRSFTIYNRLTITGGGGTVTGVSVSTAGVSDLLTVNVSNPTTSPAIAFTKPPVLANTFYGSNIVGNPSFMSAATARTALGGSTVGQAIFQLTNPSQVGFIRTNVDNTVTALTSAATLTALGAESALTFSPIPPFSRSGNTITLAAASSGVSGYLTGTDWTTFNTKVGTGITLTASSPLVIDGLNTPLNLSTNRIFSMPAATGNADGTSQRDGFLTGTDHSNFANKPPNSRTIGTTAPLTISGGVAVGGGVTAADISANRTITMPKATATVDGYLAATDFAAFYTGSPHADIITQTSGSWVVSSPTTRVVLRNVLTSTLSISLPNPALYNPATTQGLIEIVDGAFPAAQTNFGVTLVASSGTIDNVAFITLPRATGYVRLNSDGIGRWTTTKYFVDSFRDSLTPTKAVRVDVSKQIDSTGVLTLAQGDSVTVSPVANTRVTGTPLQFVTGIGSAASGSAGVLSTASVFQSDIQSNQDDITVIVGNAYSVSDTGDIDNIRLTAALAAPLTVTLPSVSGYSNGQPIFFYDASGSITTTNTVTLLPRGSNTVNGGGTGAVLNRTFDSRRIIANPSTNNWTVESYGGAIGNGLNIGGFVALTDTAAITAFCDQNLTEQHWTLTGTVGVGTTRTITLSTARIGERFRLLYTHYTTNDTVAIAGAYTPNGGAGLLTLSTGGSGVIDSISGTVFAAGKIAIDTPTLNITPTAAVAYSTAADTIGTAGIGNTNNTVFDTTGARYRAGQFLAGSPSYTVGRVDLDLRAVGTAASIVGNLVVDIATDVERVHDTAAGITSGSNVVTSTAVVAGDVGQLVTSDTAGVFTNPAYIGAVTTPGPSGSFTVVTTKGGSTPLNATTGSTGVSIKGKPGAILATSTPVVPTSMATSYAGTTAGYTQFVGFAPTPLVSGTSYWIVVHNDSGAAASAVNFVQWRSHTSGNTGYITRVGANYPPLGVAANSNKCNFVTYKQ